MTESPNDRLRLAREKAGFKTASAFASQYELPESTYRSAENGNRGIPLAAAKRYAQLLGVTWQWLMEGGNEHKRTNVAVENKQNKPFTKVSGLRPRQEGITNDAGTGDLLAVLGMAEGGPDGWNLFNGDVIQYIARPANLIGVTGAYAVFVTGHSMEPRYHPGELAHIHPGKPVLPGAYVLVQKKPKADGEHPLAVIKRLVKRSGNRIILGQLNPPKEFEIKADEVVSMHRVVGSSEA